MWVRQYYSGALRYGGPHRLCSFGALNHPTMNQSRPDMRNGCSNHGEIVIDNYIQDYDIYYAQYVIIMGQLGIQDLTSA